MTLDFYLVYARKPGQGIPWEPRALVAASSPDEALTGLRSMNLGQRDLPEWRIERAITAPFEDVVRLALLALYAQMYQAGMAAQQAAALAGKEVKR
jgi:hypothetical protein